MGHVVSRYLIAAGRLARIDFESSSLVTLVYNSLTDDSCLQAPGTGQIGADHGPSLNTLAGYRLRRGSLAIGAHQMPSE